MLYCNRRLSARGARGRAPAARWTQLLVLLLCVAVLGQSVVLQSHVHAPAPPKIAAASLVQTAGDNLDAGSNAGSGKASHDCFLCREAAAGGHYLFAPPIGVAFLLPVLGWLSLAMLPNWPLPPPPVGWLGRAPPQ